MYSEWGKTSLGEALSLWRATRGRAQLCFYSNEIQQLWNPTIEGFGIKWDVPGQGWVCRGVSLVGGPRGYITYTQYGLNACLIRLNQLGTRWAQNGLEMPTYKWASLAIGSIKQLPNKWATAGYWCGGAAGFFQSVGVRSRAGQLVKRREGGSVRYISAVLICLTPSWAIRCGSLNTQTPCHEKKPSAFADFHVYSIRFCLDFTILSLHKWFNSSQIFTQSPNYP